MYSVPVRCDSHGGVGELKGILRFDGKQLSLQYQTADPIMHEFRTPPDTVELAADTLVKAEFRAGFLWLFPSVDLRVSDFGALAKLPTPEAGRLRLRIRWSERVDARKIIDGVNAASADLRLARLDQSINEMTASLGSRSRSHAAPPSSGSDPAARQAESE